MCDLLRADILPPYLDKTAAQVLASARTAFRRSGLDKTPILSRGEDRYLLAPWTGTVGTASLAIVLASLDYRVGTFDGILEVSSPGVNTKRLIPDLEKIAADQLDLPDLVAGRASALVHEKFHRYLSDDLLVSDALSSRLDLNSVPAIARRLCATQ